MYDPPIVETAGKLWEQAVTYEGYALLLSQLLLFGVLLKKQAFIEAPILIPLFAFTLWRVLQLRRVWGRKAKTLPLRVAIDLDAGRQGSATEGLASDLAPYTTGGLARAKAA